MNFNKTSNEPKLFKDGLKYFEQIQKWDKEYISTNFGEIMCKYSDDGRPVRSKNTTTYNNYINDFSDKSYAFTREMYDGKENKIIDDITFPNPFFSKNEIDKHIFFCGPCHTGALPHSHGKALNLMVSGRKRWIMFDSKTNYGKQLENYYYMKYPSTYQWMDWFSQEYKQLKANSNIKLYEFIQEPGDIVFIPDFFNHTVFNMKNTIGVVLELK